MVTNRIVQKLRQPKDAAPLVVFRIFFGLIVLCSIIRFAAYGWIDKLYIQPSFHFSYYGFEWIQPIGQWTYLLYCICGLSAIGVSIGYRYQVSSVVLFCSWTYIELMDKTYYLNHYYAISLIALLLVLLPAANYFSVDTAQGRLPAYRRMPRFYILVVQVMIGVIYLYAGLAKINTDWLLHGEPLRTWLPSKYGIPLIGPLLELPITATLFSWAGMLFDISVPFLLLLKKTRPWAFAAVIIFHVLTWILFPIGVFPFVMIICATIFLGADFHSKIIDLLAQLFRLQSPAPYIGKATIFTSSTIRSTAIAMLLAFHILFPWRYLLYPCPQDLFWTEYGFRYSWRVMLMEKAGYATFTVVDTTTGNQYTVRNEDHLNPVQEKQMSTQPDMIIQYAHYLERHYQQNFGINDPAIYVESYVALNGRRSQPYVMTGVDLTRIKDQIRSQHLLFPYDRQGR